ncbi:MULTISPECIES: carboxymuconolactone decarboxylase family protein [unclassified Mycobacterium]|uniref:carboxymuconolactone decarboxylase family protein n=1 Tax=unclassified Mycobacterium TaxID=2642494 RepID=UPI000740164E|nr:MULTISPECIES: carboxymuconolactone decarboxylase family protein [unclassified Mycobacterium]KUH84958.1 carboxymuconolactone decarboxylase [Mycobacterium sp. GA-0227b]KUH87440.1 carboxymuconolactone decarboxylase [Mycobacterium sp. GA-1999]KUH90384.1 carboxymuconolactone decarboxylase [Mycobacterium sp. IS-1556]
MPRLDPVPRAKVSDEFTLNMYDFMFGDRDPIAEPGTIGGTTGDWWTVFAQSPAALRHAVRGFRLYREEVTIRPDHRELGQIRAGWVVGSQFVFSQHCKACRSAGLSEEKIAAIPSWQTADCFDHTERLLLAYTDCLAGQQGRVPERLFEQLREVFGDREILEFTYTTTMYVMHAIMSRALRLEFDDRDDPVVEVKAADGSDTLDIGAATSGDEN